MPVGPTISTSPWPSDARRKSNAGKPPACSGDGEARKTARRPGPGRVPCSRARRARPSGHWKRYWAGAWARKRGGGGAGVGVVVVVVVMGEEEVMFRGRVG